MNCNLAHHGHEIAAKSPITIQELLSSPNTEVTPQHQGDYVISAFGSYPETELLQINPSLNSQTHTLITNQSRVTNSTITPSTNSARSCQPFLSTSAPIQSPLKKVIKEPLLIGSNRGAQLDEKCLQEGLGPSIAIHQNYTANCIDNKLCYQILHSRKDHQEAYKEHQLQMAGGSLDSQRTSCEIRLASSDESDLETGGVATQIATLEEIQVPVFIHAESEIFNDNNPLSHCGNTNGSFCEEDTELLNFDFEVTTKHIELMKSNNYNNFYNNGDSTSAGSDSANNIYNTNKNKPNEWEKKKEIASAFDFGHRTNLELDSDDVVFTEEAINISDLNNDNYSFLDIFCLAQNDSILMEETQDTFLQKISDAEPVVPNINDDEEYTTCIEQQQTPEYIKYEMDTKTKTFAEDPTILSPIELSAIKPVLKRKCNGSHNVYNKRRRLHLNTSAKLNVSSIPLTTPDVVNLIADWGKTQDLQSQPIIGDATTPEDIIKDLLDVSTDSSLPANVNKVSSSSPAENGANQSITNFDSTNSDSSDSFTSSINSLMLVNIFNSNTIDTAMSTFSSSSTNTTDNPRTASFLNSHSKNTDCSSESSSLTAVSTAETTTLRGSTRKRGRPSKEHSDMPDPARLKQLSDAERKRAEDRAKNNEASRLSRLKNKLKEEAEIKEAKLLSKRNAAMKLELDNLNRVLAKLKRALQHRHFQKPS